MRNVVDLPRLVEGEDAENFFRQALTPSELVDIRNRLMPLERRAAKRHQAQAGPKKGQGKKPTGSGK